MNTQEAIDVARALAPRLRKRVALAESLRRLPDENVTDLVESGLLSLETPRRWGGPELNMDALIEVTAALAEGCSSTGWVYTIWATHILHVAQFPESVQEMVFTNQRPMVASILNTIGQAERVDGGYVLNCAGKFCSGIDHSTWVEAKVAIKQEAGAPAETGWFLVPCSEVVAEDDWVAVGLRGTGSKTVRIEGVFVPQEMMVSDRDMNTGVNGANLYETSLFQADHQVIGAFSLYGPSAGIGRAAVSAFEETCRDSLKSGADQSAKLLRLASAAARVDATHAMSMDDARRYCFLPASAITAEVRSSVRLHRAYAVQQLRHVTNDLFEASGSSSVYESSEMARLWRDANVAAAHRGSSWDTHAVGMPGR